MPGGFKLLDAFIEVEGDGSKVAEQASRDIEGSPLADKAGSGFGKKVVAGIGLALAGAALGEKFADAMDIQVGQQKLTASLDLTKQQAGVAGKVAGQLYSSNYGDSMEDVQDAVGVVMGSLDGMKTANEQTVNAMTTKLLNLRSAFGIDVAESAATAGALVKSGLATNTNQAVDLMTAGLQKVPPAMRGALVDAVTEYAPQLHGLGFSGQQGFAMLVDAAKGGEIQIDKAGDALKEFSIRATDGSKSSAQAFKAAGLGPQMGQLSNDLLAGGDRAQGAFKKIVAGLQGIDDPSARAQAAIGLFGTPLEDISVNDVPKFLSGLQQTGASMDNAKGAADRMGATLNDTTANSIQSIQRGFQGWTNDLIMNSGALGGVATVAGTIGPQLLSMGGALAVIVPALSNLGVFTKIAAAGQWLLNAAMSANPIGIVVALIAGLVAALIWFFTQTTLGRTIWAGFIAWFQAVIAGFAAWWNGVWSAISAFVGAVWSGIVAAVTAYVNTLRAGIVAAITTAQAVWSAVTNTIAAVARAVWGAIVGFVTGYVNTLRAGIVAGITAAQAVWSAVTNTIRSVAQSVWGSISSFISGVVGTIRGAITGAINTARSVWESGVNVIRSATSSAFNAAVGAVRSAVNTIGNIVDGIRGTVQGALAGAGSWLVDAGRNIIQGLINGIKAMLGAVGSAISGVVNFIKDHLPHSPAKRGPMSGRGWTQGVIGAGEAIVGGIASGFNDAASSTRLGFPDVVAGGKYAGTMVAPGSSAAAQAAGAARMGGDTYYTTLQVSMDEVSEVSRLLRVVESIPQQARAGRQVVGT